MKHEPYKNEWVYETWDLKVEDYNFNDNNMTDTLKRFAISSLVTFVSTFGIFFFSAIQSDSFVFSKATLYSAVISAVFVAVRALAKVVVEFLMNFNKE